MTTEPWKDAILPDNYGIDEDGLYIGEQEYLSDAPIWMSRQLIDIETNFAALEVCYLVDDVVQKITLDRQDIYSTGWLAKLGALHRFPYPPENAKPLRKYLYLADLACSETSFFSATAGWKTLPDSTTEFVPFGKVEPNPIGAGAKQRFAYIHEHGSFSTWLGAVLPALCENRRACVPFAASLAAPILSLLNADSVVIDVFNTSSSGKTIACTMAMSIWGNGEKLKLNWDTTVVGLEQNAAAFTDLPLFFDESQLNRDPKSLGVAVYNIANGIGKVRGAAGGGTQITRTWKTCLLSTGEAALLELIPTTYAGLDARIIPVPGKTLGALDGAQAERLNIAIHENYGFLGPRFIEHLKTVEADDLEHRWHEAVKELRLHVGLDDNIQRRKAEPYAVLLLAIDQLALVIPEHEGQCLEIHKNLIDHWQDIADLHVADQIAQEALCVLMDFFVTHETAFTKEHDWGKRLGKVQDGKIMFLKETWNRALTKSYAKFSPENILREFIERQWIELDKDGKPDPRVSWGASNKKARVYIITPLAMDEYDEKFKGKIFSYIDYLYEQSDPSSIPGGPNTTKTEEDT